MTLDDLERQNRGFYGFFSRYRAAQVYIIHKASPRFWRWWRGVVGNAFWLKQSYSTPGPVSRGDRGTVEHFSIFGDTAAISMNLLIIYSVINIRPTLGNLTPRTCQ